MALTDKLRDLDQRLLPGTRDDGEDAETYLRRVAASRAISPAQAGDVMAALRVYFGVEPGAGEDSEDSENSEGGGDGDEESSGEQKDQADEQADDKSDGSEDESDDGHSEDSGDSDEEKSGS